VWALNGIISLGQEFCGSQSPSLRKCLDEKSREYFTNFHVDSFHTLRQMLREDSWQNMPLSQAALRQMGGVLGIIKSHCPRDAVGVRILRNHCDTKNGDRSSSKNNSLQHKLRRSSIRYSSHDQAKPKSSETAPRGRADSAATSEDCGVDWEGTEVPSILMMFDESGAGNPFHFMTVDENQSHQQLEAPPPPPPPPMEDIDGFWQILNESDSSAVSSTASVNTHMVVTQTALNGLSKFTAKYLHMMYILPDKSGEIFGSLMQLFDLYICTVYHGFIPAEEKAKFFMKPTKLTAPAPDQCREFEVEMMIRSHSILF
jgi:hypothetical protein